MLKEWFDKDYILYACAGLCGLGFLIKFISNLAYWRLVKASENMATSKNKLVREIKLKFESFYKLSIGVNNVDIFVDKYVYKHRFCGLLLSTWDNLGGLMFALCMITPLIASIYGVMIKCGLLQILSTILVGVAASSILFIVDKLFDISSKKVRICINMKDYLENYLQIRLEQEVKDPEGIVALRAEVQSKEQKSPRQLKKEALLQKKKEKREQKELQLEAKQQEKADRKREKEEARQAQLDRKEAKRQQLQEQREQEALRKEEAKRQAQEAKQARKQERMTHDQQVELMRNQAAQKLEQKRQESERRLEEEIRVHEELKQREEEGTLHVGDGYSASLDQQKKEKSEVAVAKEYRNKDGKVDKAKERHDRLKEEIRANREQRNRELAQGKDPYETYLGVESNNAKKVKPASDFNMEYEMRVKAAQREEWKRQNQDESQTQETANKVAATKEERETVSVAAAKTEKPLEQNEVSKRAAVVRGNNPYEDKVIDDILKEFLA